MPRMRIAKETAPAGIWALYRRLAGHVTEQENINKNKTMS